MSAGILPWKITVEVERPQRSSAKPNAASRKPPGPGRRLDDQASRPDLGTY